MANGSLQERVGITEVQIDHLEEKIDSVHDKLRELSQDIRDSNTALTETLKTMQEASTQQHGELASKIKDLENLKNKWVNWATGALFVLTVLGASNIDVLKSILKLIV